MKDKDIKKDKELEKEYDSLVENKADIVEVRNKKYRVKWLRPGTQRKLSSVMVKYGDDDTLQHRCAAICILNNYFKIKLLYPFLWRWFFFVKEYTAVELSKVLEISKKKVQQQTSLMNMVLLIGVKDTLKSQTMSSVESSLRKLASEHTTQSKED